MERYFSTGQSPQWAVAPMKEEEKEEEKGVDYDEIQYIITHITRVEFSL
jgi:hypothetical protein